MDIYLRKEELVFNKVIIVDGSKKDILGKMDDVYYSDCSYFYEDYY